MEVERERERNLISNLFRKVSRPSQAKICKWRFLLELSLVEMMVMVKTDIFVYANE